MEGIYYKLTIRPTSRVTIEEIRMEYIYTVGVMRCNGATCVDEDGRCKQKCPNECKASHRTVQRVAVAIDGM